MALATRCPACSTVFRISTAQAAAKGGMVRCGQCRNVFNSLDALVRVEDLEVLDEAAVEASAEAAGDAVPMPHVDDAWSTVLPDDPASAEGDTSSEPSPATQDDPVERAVIREWWLPEETQTHGTQTATATPDDRSEAGRLLSGARADLQATESGLAGTGPLFMRPAPAPVEAGRAGRWVFGFLSLIATVALLAQAAFLWRDELAVRWAPARPWLVAACVPLRCTVAYPAHIDAITIESASIQTSGANPNLYALNALLRNRDTVDIRYPHLELVLTDLQDRPILRRALRPEDYLGPNRPALSGFAAESELTIHLLFELGDLRFAGYRLDKFYP